MSPRSALGDLGGPGTTGDRSTAPLVQRAIDRGLAAARASAARDVDRLIEATYEVAQRDGTVEPTLRSILRAADLSTEAFYRHFSSKDELLLVVLADGRQRLAGYLAHRMEKAEPGWERVRSWIEGVLAQAVDPAAAARTRPFVANLGRLTERFPEEMARSVDAMVGLLDEALASWEGTGAPARPTRTPGGRAPGGPTPIRRRDRREDAMAVYRLVVATMETHVLSRTVPSPHETEHLVGFCRRAAGL